MMRMVLAGVVAVAGCDRGEDCCSVDAHVPDMLDVPADAYLPPHHYVMDSLRMPMTNTQARDYGLDLDGDQVVDNQLGMVLATFDSMGLDAQAEMTIAVDRGTVIYLLEVATTDFASAPEASATVLRGTSPAPSPCSGAADTVCRRHLDGAGVFAISPTDTAPMRGAIVDSTLRAGPGRFVLEMVFHGGGSLVALPLIGTRTRMQAITDSSIGSIVLAGAVPSTDISTKVVPALRDSFAAAVARDCTDLVNPPNCGCANDSAGKTALGLFDINPRDCALSVEEVRDNSLVASLLAPDVTIDGQQALSVGVSGSAVRATFTGM
jgi:hypothetical protein